MSCFKTLNCEVRFQSFEVKIMDRYTKKVISMNFHIFSFLWMRNGIIKLKKRKLKRILK